MEVDGDIEFFAHPHYGDKIAALGVASVIRHRFAFYYWWKWNHEYKHGSSRAFPYEGEPLTLITLDRHDDVGLDDDYPNELLVDIDLKTEAEINLFCLSIMRKNNDGNIWPAQYLDIIGDAHVILRNRTYDEMFKGTGRESHIVRKSKSGRTNHITYYRETDCFLSQTQTSISGPIILDIDVDYFSGSDNSNNNYIEIDRIRNVFSGRGCFWKSILSRCYSVTMALEPDYCGGLFDSFFGSSYILSLMIPKTKYSFLRNFLKDKK